MTAPDRATGRWRWVAVTAGAVGAVVLLGAWLWPGVARDGDRVDVLVVGDGEVGQARDAIERRLREQGLRTEVVLAATPCEALPTLRDSSVSVVVLSFRSAGGGCDGGDTLAAWTAARQAAGAARTVLLVQPGPPPAGQDGEVREAIGALEPRRDTIVADPSTLLAEREGSPARLACQWWDDCEPDGFVTVRQPDGALTPAGGQRLARVLAGAIP